MFQKLRNMWKLFLNGIKLAKEAYKNKKIDKNAQDYTDIERLNFLSIASKTISNLACTEATFEVKGDSIQVDVLKELCKDLENNRFEITEQMLGMGDFYTLPYFNEKGMLKHSYLSSDRVRIIGENEVEFVIDYFQTKNGTRTYFLMRNHRKENDSLIVTYHVVEENGKETSVHYEPWNYLIGTETVYTGEFTNMGYGRYKCPTSSRGLSQIYGVPMNFGCGQLEADVFETLNQIKDEFKNGKSVIITDPRNLKFDDRDKTVKIPENVLPMKKTVGMESELTIFSPTLRYSEHYEKLQEQLSELEYQMGLNNGIFTKNEAMATATATAVKRSNSNTIAFINSVRNVIDVGNKQTLEADAMYLNVSPDLWEYNSDWYDPFEDSTEQFNYLLSAYNAGAIKRERITKWIYPQMTDEQIAEELSAIDEVKNANTTNAILASLTQ